MLALVVQWRPSASPQAAAPGPEQATRVMGPPSSRQERITPGTAPTQAPAPSSVIRALGPAVTSAASVPFAVCSQRDVDVPNMVPSIYEHVPSCAVRVSLIRGMESKD